MVLGLFSKDAIDWKAFGGRTDDGSVVQFAGLLKDSEIPTLVEIWFPNSRHTSFVPGTYKLVRQSGNYFKHLHVREGGLMIILSSEDFIDVHITAEDNSTLIIGQMSNKSIQKIAKLCKVSIEDQRGGVYKLE
jgi:hypothetical protein